MPNNNVSEQRDLPGTRASIDIVIPVLDQLHYTERCLETLRRSTDCPLAVTVVNNGSKDGTADFLAGCNWIEVISNETNRGCAAAWNQGVRAGNSEWVVVLNNDVVLPKGWLEGLLDYAEEMGADVVSPGIREGKEDYDVEAYGAEFMGIMRGAVRRGEAHGVCFAVRRRVFEAIGYFDEGFTIGGSEDTDFFWRAKKAGLTLATTGRSFLHHFGSVTQEYVKATITMRCYGPEHRAYFRTKWKLTWWRRKVLQIRGKSRRAWYDFTERVCFGRKLR
jgi:N-acetylglucosaminyl-diphospho-decaprenol L-rhamnosyltransferase